MIRIGREGTLGHVKSFVVTVIGAIVLGFVLYVCWVFWQRHQRQERELAVPGEAAITAGMLVEAQRTCVSVGIDRVEDCARTTGTEYQNAAAQMLATLAVGSRDNYFVTCGAFHDRRTCAELLARAVDDSSKQSVLSLGEQARL